MNFVGLSCVKYLNRTIGLDWAGEARSSEHTSKLGADECCLYVVLPIAPPPSMMSISYSRNES